MRRKGTDRHLIPENDPRLHEVCRPVEPGQNLDRIMDLMERVCKRGAVPGVALAAPQIGETLQLIYVTKDGSFNGRPYFMINPLVIEASDESYLDEEGCLSFPGRKKIISRQDWITVNYLDERRQTRTSTSHNYHARVVQHELDHLRGVCRVGDDSPPDGVLRKKEPGSLLPLASLLAVAAGYGMGRGKLNTLQFVVPPSEFPE